MLKYFSFLITPILVFTLNTALAHSKLVIGQTCSKKYIFFQHTCWDYPGNVPGKRKIKSILFEANNTHGYPYGVCTNDKGGTPLSCQYFRKHKQTKWLKIPSKTHSITLASDRDSPAVWHTVRIKVLKIEYLTQKKTGQAQ